MKHPRAAIAPGTYADYPALTATLPKLVREQRTLVSHLCGEVYDKDGEHLGLIDAMVEREKKTREQIDALLILAGLPVGEHVTCLGYDVTHCSRKGQISLNETKLVELLVAGGVDRDFVTKALADSTETGEPPKWATVKASKGSKVRAVRAA